MADRLASVTRNVIKEALHSTTTKFRPRTHERVRRSIERQRSGGP
jgi:hypothetical protein